MSEFPVRVFLVEGIRQHPHAENLTMVKLRGHEPELVANKKDDGSFRYEAGVSLVGFLPVNALLPTFFISNAMTLMAQGTLYSLLSVSAFKGYAAFLALQLGVGLVARVREPFAGPASRGYRSEHAR